MPERSGSFASRRRTTGLADQSGFVGSVARFWQRSHAGDYVGLVVLLTLYILLQFFVEPFHRMFTLDNTAIQFPHAEVERVSVPSLFIYAGAVPLGALILWAIALRPSGSTIHVTILGWFTSLLLTCFITDVIKNAVGRPRPDLLARCSPTKGTPEHELVSYSVCSQTDHHLLHDGWRSFPSGHSSFAFSGLGYISLVVSGYFHVFTPGADLARMLLALLPLLGAALIAISRCEDYRHDVYDVTVGSILGFLIAWLTYRRYYPSLRSAYCDVPYVDMGSLMSSRGNGLSSGSLDGAIAEDDREEDDIRLLRDMRLPRRRSNDVDIERDPGRL